MNLRTLYALLICAKNGGFPDDYPREKLCLEPNIEDFRNRKIFMLVTPQEREMIEIYRKEICKAVIEAIESAEPQKNNKK